MIVILVWLPVVFFLYLIVLLRFFILTLFHLCHFPYPLTFTYRMSTRSLSRDNKCEPPDRISQNCTCTCFELTLSRLVLALTIFSCKKALCPLAFKLASDLDFLVHNI